MTDVSTYIEAEDSVDKFYEKYNDMTKIEYLDTHNTIYLDSPICVGKNKDNCLAVDVAELDKNCNTS